MKSDRSSKKTPTPMANRPPDGKVRFIFNELLSYLFG